MRRRLFFFSFGVVLSVFLLNALDSENRLNKTLNAYIDYFNVDKRVITHLKKENTSFSVKSQCQMVYHNLSKEDILSVLNEGDVNFSKSKKDLEPCQYFLVDNMHNSNPLSVFFEYCFKENSVQVMNFVYNNEKDVCLD